MFLKNFRSYQRGSACLCRPKGCKFLSHQIWQKNTLQLAHYAPRPGGLGLIPWQWDHPKSLTYHNFAAIWLAIPLWKDLNFFKSILLAHKTGMIYQIVFALSKWPLFTKYQSVHTVNPQKIVRLFFPSLVFLVRLSIEAFSKLKRLGKKFLPQINVLDVKV